jgi:hypothetical protein
MGKRQPSSSLAHRFTHGVQSSWLVESMDTFVKAGFCEQ